MTTEPVWCLVDAKTGGPLVVDGRLPVYWYRSVARAAAKKYGFKSGAFRIVKARIYFDQ